MFVPPRPAADNMARDTALIDRARETGETVLSVYSWETPTLSLGRNQLAAGRYDREKIAAAGLEVVRRPTGGRALIHHHEVTYSVTGPIADGVSLHASYERINEILIEALKQMGVDAAPSSSGSPTPAPGELPCFSSPAEGELIADGAKLVGSAQYRERGAFLQHGSILVRDDQRLIASLLIPTGNGMVSPMASTLSELLGREPSADEVSDNLFAAVRKREDSNATVIDEASVEVRSRRYLEHYRNELWTWRR